MRLTQSFTMIKEHGTWFAEVLSRLGYKVETIGFTPSNAPEKVVLSVYNCSVKDFETAYELWLEEYSRCMNK